ncbi:MAG: hypothetical protein LH465_04290 [Sphingomonas bacterium]|nr:hypothetical protein [Sphingomonas bacterium]
MAFAFPDAYPLMQALIERGIVGDYREPDLMRFGFAPLYNGFADVWRTVDAIAELLAGRAYDQPRFRKRSRVT